MAPNFPRARQDSDLKSRLDDPSPPLSPTPYTTRPEGWLNRARGAFFWTRRKLRYHWPWIVFLIFAIWADCFYHTRPALRPLSEATDEPFAMECHKPPINEPRANATLLMLARNEDVHGAVQAVNSMEKRFNKWANYPIAFLNDKPFNSTFKEALRTVASGEVSFAQIPSEMWSIPPTLDPVIARKAMARQGEEGMPYAGQESYHHMCRFNSGMFYDVPELQKYRWYWRIEPDVRFTCDITYDPFVEMQRRGKKYGYIIALWELTPTVPTLFRKISDYKARMKIPSSRLWTALIKPNVGPWPIRKLMSWTHINRDRNGDSWNVCHFWSNFEIADMDWYRSKEYRDLFRMLDLDGGFYLERWGDAPVHTLAAALLLKDHEIHHFRDWGYSHPPFSYLPVVPKDGRVELNHLVGKTEAEWSDDNELLGCNCDLEIEKGGIIDPSCHNVIQRAFQSKFSKHAWGVEWSNVG